MKEKDWFKIDRANGRFEGAWAELRAAYVEQIKRLEKQLDDANKALKEVCMHAESEHFECRCGWREPCKNCNAHYSARDYLKKYRVKK